MIKIILLSILLIVFIFVNSIDACEQTSWIHIPSNDHQYCSHPACIAGTQVDTDIIEFWEKYKLPNSVNTNWAIYNLDWYCMPFHMDYPIDLPMKIDTTRVDTVGYEKAVCDTIHDWSTGNLFHDLRSDEYKRSIGIVDSWVDGDYYIELKVIPIIEYTIDTSYYLSSEQKILLEGK